jgi:hypothetical protein
MLGIATSIFWVLLLAFIVSAAVSVKDLSFGVGEPQFAAAPNHDLIFSLPIYIDNNGYYSLKAFNITTVFSDAKGAEISRASSFVPVISQGQNVTIFHNVTLSLDSMLTRGEEYLFKDNNLMVSASAGLNFVEFIPVQVSTNFTYPWGAPFNNFMLGQPSFDPAQGRVTVPLSFENHAGFDFDGTIKVELYDSANSRLGESETAFNALQGSRYQEKLEFHVPLIATSLPTARSGHYNVYFSTSFLEYGPLVIPYG